MALSRTVSKILKLEFNLRQPTVKIFMILASIVLRRFDSSGVWWIDRRTQTDASTITEMRETSHAVAREKLCRFKFRSLRLARILSLAHGKKLAHSRSSRFLLATALAYRSSLRFCVSPRIHVWSAFLFFAFRLTVVNGSCGALQF